MCRDSEKEGIDKVSWDSDEEEEPQNQIVASSAACLNYSRVSNGKAISFPGEASSSAGPSYSNLISEFVLMGFSADKVIKAIQENGEDNSEAILNTLLAYSVHEEPLPEQKHTIYKLSPESAGDDMDFSDEGSDLGNEECMDSSPEKGHMLKLLVDMGYYSDEASIAMERCGPNAPLEELTDFISAAQMAREADAHLAVPAESAESDHPSSGEDKEITSRNFLPPINKKRRLSEVKSQKRRTEKRYEKREKRYEKRTFDEDDEKMHIPKPMIGFGVPTQPRPTFHRTLPEAAIGPPYFYYENVALTPLGVWKKMSSFLYEIEPEFVDSQHFSAAARKRGYIHNLPTHNRFPLLPIPPQTIHEAFPPTKRWWPGWDRRTKLNCLQTCLASAKNTERIRQALETCDGEPPMNIQKYVLYECKKWNLVWVGKNKVAPLEPDEIESLLGFPKNHTRGGGISRTERLKGLGNSFQIDTVAYHLSVLKDLFPNGINVLSLFSGIGGAEVALHRLGIPLKNVVAVEINEYCRNVLRSWWESTNQEGNLIDITDVQLVDADMLERLMNKVGGFDLIIGGSPCNNIAGSNRHSRVGLEGKDSCLFFDYFRILNEVKILMGKS